MKGYPTPYNQLPKEIKSAFMELNVLNNLNIAGFKKKFEFTYTYLLVRLLVKILQIVREENKCPCHCI